MPGHAPEILHHAALDARLLVASRGIRLLQSVSWLIPHTYVVDALRQLLLDGGEASSRVSVGNAVLALGSFTVVAYAVGLVLFSKSLHYARRRGILGSY